MGHTSNKDIRIAKSVVDYIARWLGLTFMSGSDHGPSATAKADTVNSGNGPETLPETSPPISSVMETLKQDSGAAVALAERATMLASLTENGNGAKSKPAKKDNNRQDQFARFQVDAPSCDNCGSITVRNGNCYLCHNCGASMGCS